MTTATRRRGLASAAVLTILVLAGACSSSDGDDAAGDGRAIAADAPQPAQGGGDTGASVSDGEAFGSLTSGDAPNRDAAVQAEMSYALDAVADEGAMGGAPEAPKEAGTADGGDQQKLISNGAVQLKSDDVGKTVFDVRNVVDKYAGEVEANSTETDKEGAPLRSRLKVRIPTKDFDNAMQELEGVGVLIASSGNTEDVTTEVLDRDIRIQVQRRSIERISLLLDQATSIRDIVNIESQLSQRQADLAVLEKEQHYLDDQTAMATINVSVERIKDEKVTPKPKDKDDSGFFAGLSDGWHALKDFGDGFATVAGALLPWLVVGGVLAIPGLPLYRRLRRKVEPTPAPAG